MSVFMFLDKKWEGIKFWTGSCTCRRQSQDSPFDFVMKGDVTNVCLMFQNEWLMVMYANDMSLRANWPCCPAGDDDVASWHAVRPLKRKELLKRHKIVTVIISRLLSGCSCQLFFPRSKYKQFSLFTLITQTVYSWMFRWLINLKG
jgi:hypothetical protein